MHASISKRQSEIRSRVQREAQEQEALFRWRDLQRTIYPGIEFMFAIPNGAHLQGDGRQRAAQWGRLVRQGAKKGVHDILLPVARRGFHGLWMEMKAQAPHSAEVSDEQEEWRVQMLAQGYHARIVYGCAEAIDLIRWYYE